MNATMGYRWMLAGWITVISCSLLSPHPIARASDTPQQPLAEQQGQLAERYRKIEELFMRLADVEAAENPERAALLRRAAKKSRDSFILDRLNSAAGDLSSEKYQQALEGQKAARQELETLLKLLMSEDRPQRIREEKERISNWVKDLKRMERSERATRARTENGADLDEVQAEQKSIEEKAAEVESQLREDNDDPIDTSESNSGERQENDSQQGEPKESEAQPSESQPSESEPSESQPSESQPSESQPSESQPSESQPSESQPSESEPSESQPSESQPSESQPSESQPSESQPSESQPSESQPSESQPSESGQQQQQEQPPRTPKEAAQRAVEKARENMQKAMENLDKGDREDAVEQQRQAEAELRDAIDKLERILRQLREEEMLRELKRLEARLREMAQMQGEVLEKTQQLAATPKDQRDRQTDIRAGNLGFEEKKIVLEADRAILLLREEGSSVAFPVVVDQMRADMQRVAERLSQTKIDGITQGIQEDILAALQEMIDALQQAQRDLEKQQQEQQQQQQQQQGGGQGEKPLVEPLAELKLLRTMQTRIKATTERYGEMIPENDQVPTDADLLGLIKSLSARQIKLYQISRDLLLERNQ